MQREFLSSNNGTLSRILLTQKQSDNYLENIYFLEIFYVFRSNFFPCLKGFIEVVITEVNDPRKCSDFISSSDFIITLQ